MLTRLRMVATSHLVLLLAGAAAPAQAQLFKLTMQGALDARASLVSGGVASALPGLSPFTIEAVFDTRSANLVAPLPFPGFVAYTPTSLTMTMGGRTYDVQPFTAANRAGLSVAIFDGTTPFGPPGHYAVGVIQDPLADGAGIVADYEGASPAFTLGATGVVPATFTGYFGVGSSSGVCLVGTPGACTTSAVTPIPMTWAGQSFALVFGNYEDEASDTPTPGAAAKGVAFTATIAAVPEPGSLALVGAGVVGVAVAGRRRRARRPA